MSSRPCSLLLMVMLMSACVDEVEEGVDTVATASSCDTTAARSVATEFGRRLRSVSLLAPDSILDRELTAAYELLVTPELLQSWLDSGVGAPGRETSSPWPERIEIDSLSAGSAGSCVVEGTVVYVTSVEEVSSGAAARRPLRLRLVERDGWRIGEVELGPPSSAETGGSPEADGRTDQANPDQAGNDPAEVIRSYYAAIDAGNHAAAYNLWGDGGRSSGQTLDEFVSGFAATDSVSVQVGEVGRIEGAAGSRYVDVPVVVRAWMESGTEQRFEGSYTLRRSLVDGATAAQRAWHIYSADIDQTR